MQKKSTNIDELISKNNEEVIDAEYEVVDTYIDKMTGAKKSAKAIGIVLLCTALATSLTGGYIHNKQIHQPKKELSFVVNSSENYAEFLTTDDGNKHVIDKLTISEIIDNCNSCVYNGNYYSRVSDQLYSVTVVRKYQETIEPFIITEYKTPEGFVKIGTKCYEIPEDFDTSKGLENIGNYTEQIIPSGYVLIDGKIYEINKELFDNLNIDAVIVGIHEQIPAGYKEIKIHQLNKKIGILEKDFNKSSDPIETKEFILPSGYVLENEKGVKTVYYKIEYLVTEEQYLNYEFNHLPDNKGEYFSHTTIIVDAKPIEELYRQLGIEYVIPNKLTK